MSADLLPESIRLARASWDAATPGTRVLFYLRSRFSSRRALDPEQVGIVPFMAWDELPPETAYALAWDVQFLRRVLADGHAALKASTAILPGSGVSAAS